jgi:hypothetical protein
MLFTKAADLPAKLQNDRLRFILFCLLNTLHKLQHNNKCVEKYEGKKVAGNGIFSLGWHDI